MIITYCERVFVVFGIQRDMRMCHVILSPVACPTVPYFPTLYHKRHDFRGQKVIERLCVLIVRLIFLGVFIEQHLSTESFNGCKYHLLYALGAYTLTEIEIYFAGKVFAVTNRLLP